MELQTDNMVVHKELSAKLKRMILAGELTGRIPSERELAAENDMNIKTANKAISRLIGERLLVRIKGKGTFVREDARTCGLRESKRIGMAVYNFQWLNNPFYSEALAGIGGGVQAAGHRLQFVTTNRRCSGVDGGLYYMESFDRGEVDGMIVCGEEVSEADIDRLNACGLPLVLFCNKMPHKRLSGVCIDNVKGGADAASHLLSLGHTRIAFIQGFDSKLDRERIAGCGKALAGRGLELPADFIKTGNFDEDGGRVAMTEFLGMRRRPTAVIASDDVMAAGAMTALREAGLSCPDDVSVMGFGDMSFASKMTPALTTLKIPISEMGRTAVELLERRFQNPNSAPERKVFAADLIIRQSTCQLKDAK